MIKGVRTYDNKQKNIIIKLFEPALFPFNLSLSFSDTIILQHNMQILQGKSGIFFIFFYNFLPFKQFFKFLIKTTPPKPSKIGAVFRDNPNESQCPKYFKAVAGIVIIVTVVFPSFLRRRFFIPNVSTPLLFF